MESNHNDTHGENIANDRPKDGADEQPEDALKARLQEQENKYLYLYAEFETFKKRVQKERADLLKFGWEGVAQDLLQVLDNLERTVDYLASLQTAQASGSIKVMMDGLQMVLSQFLQTLERHGVRPEVAVGQPFDPNRHEAVTQEAAPEGTAPGIVLKEHQKGFSMHGRLLRPARVVVSQSQSNAGS